MSSESNFSFTTKIAGTDLFTVRGDSYDELVTNLVAASSVHGVKVLLDLFEGVVPTMDAAVANVEAAFPGSLAVSAASVGVQPVANFDSFQPTPPPMMAAAQPSGKQCAHGVMITRKGQSAKGEWRAHFCPTPKDTPGQCAPIFAKRGTPEWDSIA